jgi:hypothetical protein
LPAQNKKHGSRRASISPPPDLYLFTHSSFACVALAPSPAKKINVMLSKRRLCDPDVILSKRLCGAGALAREKNQCHPEQAPLLPTLMSSQASACVARAPSPAKKSLSS